MLSYEGRRKPLELRVWESAGNRTGGAISANRRGTENVFSLQDSLVFLDIDTPTKSPECYVLIWEEGKRGYDRKTLELVSSPLCPGRWRDLVAERSLLPCQSQSGVHRRQGKRPSGGYTWTPTPNRSC